MSFSEWLNEDVSFGKKLVPVSVPAGLVPYNPPLGGPTNFLITSGDFLNNRQGYVADDRVYMPVTAIKQGSNFWFWLFAIWGALAVLSHLIQGSVASAIIAAGLLFPLAYWLRGKRAFGSVYAQEYPLKQVRLSLLEQTVSASGSPLGGAVVGGLLLGGAGMVTGAVIGSSSKSRTMCTLAFPDGKRALIECQPGVFAQLQFALSPAMQPRSSLRRDRVGTARIDALS